MHHVSWQHEVFEGFAFELDVVQIGRLTLTSPFDGPNYSAIIYTLFRNTDHIKVCLNLLETQQ
jgi:hypothetical protein